MAKKKRPAAPKVRSHVKVEGLKCPVIPAAQAKSGRAVCYRVERVQRNKQKGFVTAFFSRTTGHPAGFAALGSCKRTMDPFQAAIRPKLAAERVGWECSKASAEKK